MQHAVLQIPVAMAVWDDGYGISVTKDKQIVKASVSRGTGGFQEGGGNQWDSDLQGQGLGLSGDGQGIC